MDDLFKSKRHEHQIEATWCKTCTKRNVCIIKEEVAFEQNMVSCACKSHLVVTVRCKNYVEDKKATMLKKELEDLGFIFRGR